MFLASMQNILGEMGFRPNRGRAVDDNGRVNNVIEANSLRVNVWVQNSSIYDERAQEPLVPDPNKFYVAVAPRVSLFAKLSDATFKDIRMRVISLGYRTVESEYSC
jgi:hypothetical protein